MTPIELAVVALAAGSVFFSLVAAVGIVRLPDVYARAHATSKSDTMGTGLALTAVAVVLDSGIARLKLGLLIAFVLLTNPVAAHAITRSAHFQGIPHWELEAEEDE
ncbi:monovalent cation/H(+) antiporter subunit G [Halorussus salinisoli]|uniref:monovalent cation/H(+) antiporter subunit G n=1 Tax=Halorussus salinisoli TaxID=2558242 RepID=UPI0010C1C378|nr:monovalent cation/H(+) antiporter subunit G [Halorussus salinisoli]